MLHVLHEGGITHIGNSHHAPLEKIGRQSKCLICNTALHKKFSLSIITARELALLK